MSHGNLAPRSDPERPCQAPQIGYSGHRGFSIDLETLPCMGEFSAFLSLLVTAGRLGGCTPSTAKPVTQPGASLGVRRGIWDEQSTKALLWRLSQGPSLTPPGMAWLWKSQGTRKCVRGFSNPLKGLFRTPGDQGRGGKFPPQTQPGAADKGCEPCKPWHAEGRGSRGQS